MATSSNSTNASTHNNNSSSSESAVLPLRWTPPPPPMLHVRKSDDSLSPSPSPPPSLPAEPRAHLGRTSAAAGLQSEIRSVIAQTEQLLLHEQARAPQPPRSAATAQGASPLRSARLVALEAAGYVVAEIRDQMLGSSRISGSERDSDEHLSEASSGLEDGEVAAAPSGVHAEQRDAVQRSRTATDTQYQSPGHSMSARSEVVAEEDNQEEEEDEHEAALQLPPPPQQSFFPSVTNCDINASKARALQASMMNNLVQLGFQENLTGMALDAGVQEIEHYDADCELAYVDIFMSLVKMVCDAHLDSFSRRLPPLHEQAGSASSSSSSPAVAASWLRPSQIASANGSVSAPHIAPLPFKWPVFDMAQFEFGNARAGTCFDSVCVLTNLPKVATDRTEELMELLSCNLFCMIGDPIQVVIPSVSSTGRTKGHAFLEFDDPIMARRCAAAVDGLTWGRGPFGRIRSSMFRQYQVKSPTAPQTRLDGFRGEDSSGARGAMAVSTSNSTDTRSGNVFTEMPRFVEEDTTRIDAGGAGVLSPVGGRMMRSFAASLENRVGSIDDAPFSSMNGQAMDPFPDSMYTSSEGEDDDEEDNDDDDDDDDADDLLWQAQQLDRHPFLADVRSNNLPRPLSIDEVDMDDFDDPNVVIRRQSYPSSRQQQQHLSGFGFGDADDSETHHHLSSDGEGDEDNFDYDDTDGDESWEYTNILELQSMDGRDAQRGVGELSRDEHARWTRAEAVCESAHRSVLQPSASAAVNKASMEAMAGQFPRLSRELIRETGGMDADAEKPWRSYCEELIARNREMQEQVAFARRRIVQLGHHNQKLHLLVDRVERDRDGLLFENDLLQSQLNGLEDHEKHREALMAELSVLRKRLRKKEQQASMNAAHGNSLFLNRQLDDSSERTSPSTSLEDVRFVLRHQLGPSVLAVKGIEELKSWELLLESSLAHVRATREEKALALQKKLDRQVEEQQELKLCVICLASEKSILCLPCRHLCLCEACSAREEVENCPICRLRIDEMLLVYA